jgi:Uncharacterized protein conserved in bacteria (DUF2252)
MSPPVSTIVESTERYERWLGLRIELRPDDLERKHELMREDPFTFLRATYYRWLKTLAESVPDLDGPVVPSVGDLHVENFGSWRDGEGRLVWGVNDFDESEALPYTYDLTRLATSARLAVREHALDIEADDACDAVRRGYEKALERGGGAFVLAGDHDRLAEMLDAALEPPGRWWKGFDEELGDESDLPDGARAAFDAVLPERGWRFEARRRSAGVGSRGRVRIACVGERDGSRVVRELKQVAGRAREWLGRPETDSALDAPIVRARDPLYAVRDGWVVRRLGPDCVKIDVSGLKSVSRTEELLECMGAETANVHLGGGRARAADVLADLARRRRGWLTDAADAMADATRRDHDAF